MASVPPNAATCSWDAPGHHRSEAVRPLFKRVLFRPTCLIVRSEVAGTLAVAPLRQVTLLHVIETIAGADFEELSSFYGTMERRARERMNDLLARTPGRRGEIDVAIVYGGRLRKYFDSPERTESILSSWLLTQWTLLSPPAVWGR